MRSDLISLRTHRVGLLILSRLGAVSCDILMPKIMKITSLSLRVERAHLHICGRASKEPQTPPKFFVLFCFVLFFFFGLAQKQIIPAKIFFSFLPIRQRGR